MMVEKDMRPDRATCRADALQSVSRGRLSAIPLQFSAPTRLRWTVAESADIRTTTPACVQVIALPSR